MTCFDSQVCVDCGVDTIEAKEYYMVTDGCWKRAGIGKYDGMLCIGCLESRLGKKLTPRNFSECPLNWRNALVPDYASDRLVSRLYHGGKNSKWARGALAAIEELSRGDAKLLNSLTLLELG